MPQALTTAQAAVLAFIVTHQGAHQRAPTRLEIAKHFGWRSINAAVVHIHALDRKGWIACDPSAGGQQTQRYIRVLHVSATEDPTRGCAAGIPPARPGGLAPSTPAA